MGYGGMPRPAAARPLLGYGGMLSPGARRYHVILTRHHPRPTQCKRRMPGGGTQVDLRIDQTGVRVPPIRQKSRGSTCCGSTCSFSSTRRPLPALQSLLTVTGRRGMGVCLGQRPPGRSRGMGVCSERSHVTLSYPTPLGTEIPCVSRLGPCTFPF